MTYIDGLETDRLITLFLTPGDIPAWAEYFKDPIATQFATTGDKTPEELATDWVNFALKRYEENRLGLQALVHKETGEFIGQCGILVQEVNGKSEIEIGYHLFRKYWGQGYATEAARKFRDYGFENNVADSIVSIIHPLNIRSKKVAERNGMKLVDTKAIFRGKEHELYRITREKWASEIPELV
jgi:ribosomal-protein-alanine N-acetyltransferase